MSTGESPQEMKQRAKGCEMDIHAPNGYARRACRGPPHGRTRRMGRGDAIHAPNGYARRACRGPPHGAHACVHCSEGTHACAIHAPNGYARRACRGPPHERPLLALARPLALLPPPALGEGASTSAPGEIKIVSEKHGVKKETPLKNVLQVGILIIYIMGLKLVVGVG